MDRTDAAPPDAVAPAPAPAPRPRSRLKRAGFALASIALSLLFALVALEIGLRATGWSVRSMAPLGALHRHHPVYGWELVPHRSVILEGDSYGEVKFEVNGQGFRMPRDVAIERAPGVARVFVVGDSFTAGWGVPVERCFPERLAALTGAEVINGGVDAFGTGQEWLLFRERGKQYKPDVLVVGFFVGNDFRDNVVHLKKHPWFRLDEKGTLAIDNSPVPAPRGEVFDQLLKNNFASYHFLAFHLARLKSHLQESDRWYAKPYQWWRKRDKAQDAAQDKDEAFDFEDPWRKEPSREFQESVRVAGAILDELKKDCDACGAKLLVAVFPPRNSIDPTMWTDKPTLDRDAPMKAAVKMCEERGIACLDTTAPLRAKQDSGTQTYLTSEGKQIGFHWNAAGHEVVASALERELVRRGWLGAKRP